tara:strand:- start:1769 stop:1990 length:222 start_codon:yes stop_codon:yes gene_type:complete
MVKIKNIVKKNGRTQEEWDTLIGDGIITRSKQPQEELELIKARHNLNNAWHILDNSITNYNHYIQNKLTNTSK